MIDVLNDSCWPPNKKKFVLCTQSGGIDNVEFSSQDLVEYLSKKRQRQLEKGDTQSMLTYFKSCQLKNWVFFYVIQVDVEGQLANCF